MGYKINKNWLLKNSDKEDNLDISAGSLSFSTVGFKKSKTVTSSKSHLSKTKANTTAHKRRTKKAS